MLSKWEWIEKACELNGLKKSAVIAIKLENLLRSVYDETETEAWKEDYKYFVSFSIKTLDRVIYETEYCIGCEHSSENDLDCEECLLAVEDFRCGSKKSLFYEFCVMHEKETNQPIDIDCR